MKNIKYTWNLNNSTFLSIILQYSIDGITWSNAITLNSPQNIGDYTVSVDNTSTYYRILGNSPYSHCQTIISNVIIKNGIV